MTMMMIKRREAFGVFLEFRNKFAVVIVVAEAEICLASSHMSDIYI